MTPNQLKTARALLKDDGPLDHEYSFIYDLIAYCCDSELSAEQADCLAAHARNYLGIGG